MVVHQAGPVDHAGAAGSTRGDGRLLGNARDRSPPGRRRWPPPACSPELRTSPSWEAGPGRLAVRHPGPASSHRPTPPSRFVPASSNRGRRIATDRERAAGSGPERRPRRRRVDGEHEGNHSYRYGGLVGQHSARSVEDRHAARRSNHCSTATRSVTLTTTESGHRRSTDAVFAQGSFSSRAEACPGSTSKSGSYRPGPRSSRWRRAACATPRSRSHVGRRTTRSATRGSPPRPWLPRRAPATTTRRRCRPRSAGRRDPRLRMAGSITGPPPHRARSYPRPSTFR